MRKSTNAVLAILCVCFAIGGATHVLDIAREGLLPYRYAPMPINTLFLGFVLGGIAFLWLREQPNGAP